MSGESSRVDIAPCLAASMKVLAFLREPANTLQGFAITNPRISSPAKHTG